MKIAMNHIEVADIQSETSKSADSNDESVTDHNKLRKVQDAISFGIWWKTETISQVNAIAVDSTAWCNLKDGGIPVRSQSQNIFKDVRGLIGYEKKKYYGR